jgi:hypothetical protein
VQTSLAPLRPHLIDNSPEREFDDIQPGDPAEREAVEAEQDGRESAPAEPVQRPDPGPGP